MARLLRNGEQLGPVQVADGFGSRFKGLLGRDGLDGALLIVPAKSVHSFGMRFPIDVAFCDQQLRVIDVVALPPHRLTRPRFSAHSVLEAERGAFERWGLQLGDELEVKQ